MDKAVIVKTGLKLDIHDEHAQSSGTIGENGKTTTKPTKCSPPCYLDLDAFFPHVNVELLRQRAGPDTSGVTVETVESDSHE